MKKEPRKEEIVSTSSVLFKEKGYSAVTMRDIAKAMGIKAASLYNHINSKQDILVAIILTLANEFTEGMRAIKSSDTPIIKKLEQIVALHVKITSQNTDGMASLNNDWMHLETDLDHYLQLRVGYEHDFVAIISEGIKRGEITAGNPEIMMFSILSTLRSLYLWIPKKEALDPAQLAVDLSRVLINGIVL